MNRRHPNVWKVEAFLKAELRRAGLPYVPGVIGYPVAPSASGDWNRQPRMRAKFRRDKATATGNLAEGFAYKYVNADGVDTSTGLPAGYVEPAADIRQRDWAQQERAARKAEDRERMLRRQWETLERARMKAQKAETP